MAGMTHSLLTRLQVPVESSPWKSGVLAQSSKLSPVITSVLWSYLDLFASWFAVFRTAPKFRRGMKGETLRDTNVSLAAAKL